MNSRIAGSLFAILVTLVPTIGGGIGFSAITIETVPVGNPGNSPDPNTGYGTVNYTYDIGAYDVTVSQYAAFLNSVAQSDPYGLYDPGMGQEFGPDGEALNGLAQNGSPGSYTYTILPDSANLPILATFWDATRFANWLANGQPIGPEGPGTTETGTYTLTADGIANNTITRNANSTWAVPTEDEWYKAAYYDPTQNNDAGGYWLYATQSNTVSNGQANFYYGIKNTHLTDVGSYPYPSYYGTYDQSGDINNWNETIIGGSDRGDRGGTWFDNPSYGESTTRGYLDPQSYPLETVGFRVSEYVPEPAPVALLPLIFFAMLARRASPKG